MKIKTEPNIAAMNHGNHKQQSIFEFPFASLSKTSPGAQPWLSYGNEFNLYDNECKSKTHLKRRAQVLVLKQRQKSTRELWLIIKFMIIAFCNMLFAIVGLFTVLIISTALPNKLTLI